ncbi:MAG: hypothetical protein WDN69_18620 [Aliidongia sp.]
MLYARNDGLAASGPVRLPAAPGADAGAERPFDPGLVPFIRVDQRAALSGYLGRTGPKALALGPATEAMASARARTTLRPARRRWPNASTKADPVSSMPKATKLCWASIREATFDMCVLLKAWH